MKYSSKKKKVTISLLLVIMLAIFSVLIINKYIKRFDVEILNGCSEICSSLNISKIEEKSLDELIKNFKSMKIIDHPFILKNLRQR